MERTKPTLTVNHLTMDELNFVSQYLYQTTFSNLDTFKKKCVIDEALARIDMYGTDKFYTK